MTMAEYRKKHNCDNCSLIGLVLDFAEGPEHFVCGCHKSVTGDKQREFFSRIN